MPAKSAARSASRLAFAALAILALHPGRVAAALAVPAAAPGFVVEDAAPGAVIEAPVALAFTPDGRLLVADVPGRIWVIDHGVQRATPMWAHEAEVEINGDCGLLGMALDPGFAQNRLIYLFYAVDPDTNGVDDDSLHFGRLVRYQVRSDDPNLIDESTRTVLLGTSWADGVPVASGTHSTGAVRFAADGTLLLSTGEGAHWDALDAGGRDPDLFLPGRMPPAQDRGAFRAQMLDALGGKILRIDPATGHGLPSNPFWNGDPAAATSKVWAYGLRNPYRFCIRPATGAADPAAGRPGSLFIGDVGWNQWEELDVSRQGAENFGWPCFEGPRPDLPYQPLAPSFGGCDAMPAWTAPVMSFSHLSADTSAPAKLRGNAVTSGLFYTHTQFPAPWSGRLILGDFYRGWIVGATFDANDAYQDVTPLATGMNGPVDFAIEPSTGWLYVACIIDDHVRRIRWAPGAGIAPLPAWPVLALSAPAPNPARDGAALQLTLGVPATVELSILDIAGRVVWRSGARACAAGTASLVWSGRDARGARVAPGVYLASVRAGPSRVTRRLVHTE